MSTFIRNTIKGIEGCSDTLDSISNSDMEVYYKVLEMHSCVIEKTKKMMGDVRSGKESIDILDLVPQANCHIVAGSYVDILNSSGHYVDLCHGLILGISDEGKPVNCYHSWIETSDKSVIEVWPVGALFACPMIYPRGSKRSPFGANLYLKNDRTEDHISKDPEIPKRIKMLKDLILS